MIEDRGLDISSPYGNVVFVGVTAKTEFFWYDYFLDDADGKRTAEMRKMVRIIKSSSVLW